MKNLQLFDQNRGLSSLQKCHRLTPLEKCQFCVCLKPMFWLFTKACLLYKASRIVFFYDLFSRSMTWEYRGLQRVTKGCRGLQGVTRGNKW